MMRLKTRTMKFINKAFVAVCLLATAFGTAQEIIPEKTTAVADHTPQQQQQRRKVDGVVATLGDYIVLDSDIDKTYLEMSSQGMSVKDITRCQMLGKLLEDKLYAHHAIQDSIVVSDEQVRERMNKQLDYMTEQIGSMEKVVQYFKKTSEDEFRTDLFEYINSNMITVEM